jgi:hypothetical protein
MKFTLNKNKPSSEYWNGKRALPDEINVLSYIPQMAEFELLSVVATLHGYVNAFDILTGADNGTEKDTDINAVMTAFQMYLYPKMPLTGYKGQTDKRITEITSTAKVVPIDTKI